MMGDWISSPAGTIALLFAKVSLVLLLALLASRWLSRSQAGARHLIWATALGVAVMIPAVEMGPRLELPILAAPGQPSLASDLDVSTLRLPPTPVPASSARPDLASVRGESRLAQLGVATYCLGAFVVLLPLLVGFVRASLLKRAAHPVATDVDWGTTWRGLPATQRRVAAEILVSDSVHAPVTFGLFRPTILVPPGVADWSEANRRGALIHELEHVARGDWLTQVLGRVACALYWFHPLVWFAARRLHLEAERACDERVLRHGTDPREYAQHLVDLTRHHQRRPLQAAVALASGSELADRVYSVLQTGRNRMESRRLTIGLAALIVGLGMASAAIVPTQATPDPDRDYEHESWHTPLMRAALDGDVDAVRARLRAGDNVDEDARGRSTPLILASTYGHAEMVRVLIEAGADLDKRVRGVQSDRGLMRTALVAAASEGHRDVVELLVNAGAEVDRHGRGDASALMEACAEEHMGIARFLIEKGADVDLRIKGDGNAVIAAARGGSLKILEMLVDAGADVNAGVDGDGNALIMAVRNGDRNMVEYLIRQGADPNRYVPGDETAMVAAAESGDRTMLRLLLDASDDN